MSFKQNIEHIMRLYRRLKTKAHTLILSPLFYEIGENTRIMPPVRFVNYFLIQLGKNVEIQSNCWFHVVNATKRDNSPKIILKDHVTIGPDVTISASKMILIEDHVGVARNSYISDHGHEYRDIYKPFLEQGIRKVNEVRIGSGTWISHGSVILPGAKIGKHCIIGANCVVNTYIPDYSIAVGIPAKVIRKYNQDTDSWERIQKNE